MSVTSDCGTDPAAYVLGTLDRAGRTAFELHLSACEACREEADLLQSAAAVSLTASPTQTPAPARPRQGIAAIRAHAIEQVRQASVGIGYGAADRSDTAPARRWLARPVPRPAMAGIGALLVAAVITIALGRGPSGPRYLPARVAYPGAEAALQIDGNRAELLVKGMPAPPAGELYEVWTERAAEAPRPTQVRLSLNAAGEAGVTITGGLHGLHIVFVTAEPTSGSRIPHPPVLVAAQLPNRRPGSGRH